MSGLNLTGSLFGGVRGVTAPQYGSSPSYSSGVTTGSAAFSPGMTTPTFSNNETLKPNDGFGVALWVGVGAVVLLVCLRHSLPN